jgi:transcriptional regulator with XRE-family HTH domain
MRMKSNIGWLIDKSDYSREDIKIAFNKSRNTISAWCTGKSFPNTLDLFRLAKMLDVKVDDLYEEIEDDANTYKIE